MTQYPPLNVHDWMHSRLSLYPELVVYRNKIIPIDRFPGAGPQTLFHILFQDNLDSLYTSMIDEFLVPVFTKKAMTELLSFDLNLDEYEAQVLLSELQARMYELSNIKPGRELEAFSAFVQEKHIEQTVRNLENMLKQEFLKTMPAFQELFWPGIWIKHDKNLVYQLEEGKDAVVEEFTHRMRLLYDEIFPQLSDLRGTNNNNNPFIRLYLNTVLFSNPKLSQKLLRKIRNLWKKLEKELLKESTPVITNVEFHSLLQDKVNMIYQTAIDSMTMESQSALNRLQEIVEPYRCMKNSGLLSSDFACGDYEIRFNQGIIFIGEHTRDYLIQSDNLLDYYLFKDAFVAIKFGTLWELLRNKRRGVVPFPMVVNRYGPHLFLRDVNSAEQTICMGNTILSAMTNNSLEFVDRIMNMIHMGVKVLRDGYHSKNKNTYYHRFTEAIFNKQIIHQKELAQFKHLYSSKYNR